jgi:hypothetical protein
MADATTTATDSDMFQAMEQTNKALLDVLMGKLNSSQPTYIQAAQPEAATKQPNYLLYIGIGIGVFVLLKGMKIL